MIALVVAAPGDQLEHDRPWRGHDIERTLRGPSARARDRRAAPGHAKLMPSAGVATQWPPSTTSTWPVT